MNMEREECLENLVAIITVPTLIGSTIIVVALLLTTYYPEIIMYSVLVIWFTAMSWVVGFYCFLVILFAKRLLEVYREE